MNIILSMMSKIEYISIMLPIVTNIAPGLHAMYIPHSNMIIDIIKLYIHVLSSKIFSLNDMFILTIALYAIHIPIKILNMFPICLL